MKKIYFLLLTILISVSSFAQNPIITAIVDGDCSGGNPKLLEIYADGIVDFTLYSLENQTNANTTWGSTQDLSSFGTVTNDFVYITTSGSATTLASEFPSLATAPTLISGTINVNGDDRVRIVLTSDSSVVDQYGAEGIDGTGTTWEYRDSFAKRVDGTGPNGGFVEADWSIPGASTLNGLGICQSGTDTFETLLGGIGTYTTTMSTNPTVSITGSATGLDYFESNGPSAEGTFTVSGLNLTANINVAAASPAFELSLTSGGTFTPMVTVSQTGGTAMSTIVYVRLASGLTVNTYAEDITASSTGATDVMINVSGEVSPSTPQFSVFGTPGSLNYALASGPSNEESIFVEGLFLTNDITITAPTNFEVSLTSGGTFTPTVTVAQASGTIANTEVYLRLASGLTVGPYTGDVTVSSAPTTDQTVALNGNVFGAATNALVLVGAYDGPLSGGTPKGIELVALADIPDLSVFGISSITNGAGSSAGNIEYNFPADAVSAGDRIFLATESTGFTSFFGFAPTYINGVVGINGDDSIELYEGATIIDTFGTVDCDPNATGTTCPEWDHLDGWAYRVSDTGPDGTFVLGNWTFSGPNAFDGQSDNATAVTPYPIAVYTNNSLSTEDFTSANFSIYPNPTNIGFVNIITTSNEVTNVTVFDILGKQVISQTLNNNVLNVSNLNTGVYILKLNQNGASTTKKLVIK